MNEDTPGLLRNEVPYQFLKGHSFSFDHRQVEDLYLTGFLSGNQIGKEKVLLLHKQGTDTFR